MAYIIFFLAPHSLKWDIPCASSEFELKGIAPETIAIAFRFGTNTLVQQLLCSTAEAFGSLDTETFFLIILSGIKFPAILPFALYQATSQNRKKKVLIWMRKSKD